MIFTIKSEITNLPKIIQPKEDAKTKFLRYLYESIYKPIYDSNLLDYIVDETKMARPKATKIYEQPIDENIIELKEICGGTKVYISDNGNTKLLELFDKDK